MLVRYPGYAPSNVAKDAKYSVVSGSGGGYEVRLIYRVSHREKYMLTTDRHEELVHMVNAVKHALNGQNGGAFYINEFHDVLVPDGSKGAYYAGSYSGSLDFADGELIVGPAAPYGLRPGDRWPGPHVGIRYTLAAGGTDIRYEHREGNHITEVFLSDQAGDGPARVLARRLAAVKGDSGGRIYINERSQFFAPVADEYLYLGDLGDDVWFEAPDGVERP